MTDWAERNTVQCEVVKIGLNQDKNGHILKVAIHPSELPKDLVLDPLGTRYVMVLARLNDQDEVVQPQEKSEADKIISQAGLLCRNKRFIIWLHNAGHSPEASEDGAVEAIRNYCEIVSRREFRTNEMARKRFNDLVAAFNAALSAGEVPK